MYIDAIGYAAGILILISIIPQIMKSRKSKSTKDLSLVRYIIYISWVILWFVYGILLTNGPMIVINAINLILGSSMIYLILRYRK